MAKIGLKKDEFFNVSSSDAQIFGHGGIEHVKIFDDASFNVRNINLKQSVEIAELSGASTDYLFQATGTTFKIFDTAGTLIVQSSVPIGSNGSFSVQFSDKTSPITLALSGANAGRISIGNDIVSQDSPAALGTGTNNTNAITVKDGKDDAGNSSSSAASGDIHYSISDTVTRDFSYTIDGFSQGDVIDFGSLFAIPSIANRDFSDGNIEISAVLSSGQVATINLTNVAAELTGSLVIIGDIVSFNSAIGVGSLTGGGTVPDVPDVPDVPNGVSKTIQVKADGSENSSSDNVTFEFEQANYTFTIDGFSKGDHLDFLDSASVSIINIAIDGRIDVLAADASSGSVVEVHLIGLSNDVDSGVFNAGSFSSSFGIDSIL